MQLRQMMLVLLTILATAAAAFDSAGLQWPHFSGPKPEVLSQFDHSVLGNTVNKSGVSSIRVRRHHAFSVNISVGMPLRPVRCLIDTCFADVLVAEPICKQSRTCKVVKTQQNLSRGLHGLDSVHMGSAIFRNQSMLLIGEASLPRDRDWDGICGVGWQHVAREGPPWFSSVIENSQGRTFFSLVPGHDGTGRMVIGDLPVEAMKKETLVWVSKEPSASGSGTALWMFKGGLAIHRAVPTPAKFIIDTGTSFVLTPANLYVAFVREMLPFNAFDKACGVDAAAGNLVICSCDVIHSNEAVPLRVTLRDRELMVKLRHLFRRVPSDDGGELCLLQVQPFLTQSLDPLEFISGFQGTNTSVPSLQKHSAVAASPQQGNASTQHHSSVLVNQHEPLWVLGTSFLEQFVTILDFRTGKIGFAEPVDAQPMPDATEKAQHEAIAKSNATLDAVLALQEEKALLEKKIAHLRAQLSSVETSNLLQDMEMKSDIRHLRQHNAELRVNCTLLERRIAELRLQRNEENRRSAVRGGLERESGELSLQLRMLDREQKRADAAQLSRWASVRDEVAALKKERSDLLQFLEDLREEHLDLGTRDRMLLMSIVAVLGVAVTLGLLVASCVCPGSEHRSASCGGPLGAKEWALKPPDTTRALPGQEAAVLEEAILDAE